MEKRKAKCPKCGAPLKEKKSWDGRSFIGCSRWPQCRYSESLTDIEEPEEYMHPMCDDNFSGEW